MPRAQTLVIGVTGTMTSGKAAIRYFLVDRGFKSIRHTHSILREGLRLGKEMSKRENWVEVGVKMRKEKGIDILAQLSAKKIKEGERYVVCPLRHPADIKFLKEKYTALIIFVDAPFKTRYIRTLLKEQGAGLTEKDFKRKDEVENAPSGKDKKFLTNINACKKLADEIIMNDKGLSLLNQKLDAILRKYKIPDIEDTGAYEDFDI